MLLKCPIKWYRLKKKKLETSTENDSVGEDNFQQNITHKTLFIYGYEHDKSYSWAPIFSNKETVRKSFTLIILMF